MEQISICDAAHNIWLLLHHVIDGYDEATEKFITEYPQYNFLFIFDHSYRHNSRQENGLDVKHMNLGFRGKHLNMYNTLIKEKYVYL